MPLAAGRGLGSPPYEESVFINCPFDSDFEPLFDAIVFCVVASRLFPRCALESGSISESRMRRITVALLSSRFSIHDLSRCRGEGDEKFARFNMPLELGMAIALRETQHLTGRPHDWAALVPVGHTSAKFVSDLAGYDLLHYDGTVKILMRELLPWLQERPGATVMAPARVFDAFSTFQSEKARLAEEGLGRISWANRLIAAFRTVPKL